MNNFLENLGSDIKPKTLKIEKSKVMIRCNCGHLYSKSYYKKHLSTKRHILQSQVKDMMKKILKENRK